jgi:hypothetical protein
LSAIERTTQPKVKTMKNAPPKMPFYVDDVQWQDHLWFEEHPERTCRLRAVHHTEFSEFLGSTLVIVQKEAANAKQRVPFTLLGTPPGLLDWLMCDAPKASELDSLLAALVISVLSGQAFDLMSAIREGLRAQKPTSAPLH